MNRRLAHISVCLLLALRTATAQDSLVTRLLSSTQGGLPCDETAVTLQDSDGFVWIGTRLGLYRYDGYSLEPYRNDIYHPHLFTSSDIKHLAEDRQGGLWIGTFRGLNRLDRRTGEVLRFNGGDSIPAGYIKHLACDCRGVVWTQTDKGWYAYDHERRQWSRRSSGMPEPQFTMTMRDRDGGLWKCLQRGGVALLSPRNTVFHNDTLASLDDAVRTLAADSNGRLWAGLASGDVACLDASSRTLRSTGFREAAGSPDGLMVNALAVDADGSLLIATERHGIYRLKGSSLSHITRATTPWLRDDCIYSLCTDSRGRLLAGTWAGLSVLDTDGRGYYIDKISNTDITGTHILHIYQTGPDDYWLGLIGGLLHVEGNLLHPDRCRARLYTYVDQTPSAPALAGPAADADEAGNTRYRIGGIYRVLHDSEGRLWACTSEPGLLRYDPEADVFRSISRQLGISGDNVRSIEEDGAGRLWMLTNHGLFFLRNHLARLYTTADGLPQNYYGNSTSCLMADGSVAIAAGAHITRFDPNAVSRVQRKRKPLITDIRIHDSSLRLMDTDARRRITGQLPPFTRRIVLAPQQNTLTLCFSTFDFANPEAVQFAYRMEGLDNDWVYPRAGTATARYTGLPPGSYTFRVRTSQEPDEAILQIKVLPPWWRRGWAFCLYALTAIAALLLARRLWLSRRQHREDQRLMALERERNQELQGIIEQMRMEGQVAPQDVQQAIDDYDAAFIRRCDDAIQRHLSESEFDQQLLIDEIGTSHSTLYRKLKTMKGMDATAYIRSFRMKAACDILRRHPDTRISELAYAVGFSNPKYFSTCFRKDVGTTPSEYAKEQLTLGKRATHHGKNDNAP